MNNNEIINYNEIKEIIQKADIVSIIGNFIKLQKKGSNYFGLCPFHSDNNPSLVVSPQKKIFKCFVCGTKGNVIDFVQKFKSTNFFDALEYVAKIINYDIKKITTKNNFFDLKTKRLYEVNKIINEWYNGFIFNPENKIYLEYLKNRGINDDIIKIFEIGYAPKDSTLIYKMATNNENMFGDEYDKNSIFNEQELVDANVITINEKGNTTDFLIDRITFPIYDNNGLLAGFSGRTINNKIEPKYLNTCTTKIFHKSEILFNFFRIRNLEIEKIILCEGFMDTIAFYRADIKNCVALMGTTLSDNHISAIQSLKNIKTIILSFDNDNAGNEATINNGIRLMEKGLNVYVIGDYDKKIKDVDELMNKFGKEYLIDIFDKRIDFISWLIKFKFLNKKHLDEKQIIINYIINFMVEFGDISLKTTQLKLIEKCSDIDYYDLLSKYEILSNKFYKTSKKNDFIDDFSQKENKENKNTIQKRIILKKKNEYTKINNINYDNIKKILSGIIFFCYMEPKNIDKVQKKIFFSLINSDLEEYYFILKLISIVHARHEEINIENLLKISKQDKNINYKIIEKLLINIINDEYFNKYYKNFNLEKNINDFIIKNYDIELNKKCIELIKLEEKNEKVNNNYQDKIAIMNDIEQIKNQKFILQNKILNND